MSQRTREIGVRMALGAQRSSVYQLILKEAGLLTVLGVVAGLAGAIGAAAFMGKLLFGVRSWDMPTLACGCSAARVSRRSWPAIYRRAERLRSIPWRLCALSSL